jgi:DNA-binding transcriptional LysR family regulator
MPSLNLRHIEVFHAVYEIGSISGASRVLGVSQPSVSKILRHAEGRLGFELFHIVKGRLVATNEAHQLYNDAKAVQLGVQKFHEKARAVGKDRGKHIRIATLHSFGIKIIPKSIANFCKKNQRVTIEIKTLHTDELPGELVNGNRDFVISYERYWNKNFAYRKIGDGEIVVLFRKSDYKNPPKRISFDVLKSVPMIGLFNAGTIGSMLHRYYAKNSLDSPHIIVETYYVAAEMVRHGLGFATVDEYTARSCLSDDMDFRPLDDCQPFSVYAAYPADQPLSKASEGFLDEVQEILAKKSF